ncbi:MAG: substrate-binding domain-containing protein [Aggregatilineales bacterium]
MLPARLRKVAVAAALAFASAASLGTPAMLNAQAEQIQIGLITKTETNPFFVKMRQGAQAVADKLGAKLIYASGKNDADNDSQVTAIENMVNAGVKGILLVPANSAGIVPAVKKARDAGVLVIALDTPTDPQDATDALFATDNFKAGLLIGQYAKAAFNGKAATIATLDADPSNKTGVLRHNGFLQGFGLKDGDPSIACSGNSLGDQATGQTVMENCLTKAPDINLVYAINEPAAAGAYTAINKAGKSKDVTIVAVDGGCSPGITSIISGAIAATSQQYPLKMASMGVEAVVKFATDGTKPSGYTDTGVTLISVNPQPGVFSQGAVYGLKNCWGAPPDQATIDAAVKADAAKNIPAEATQPPTATMAPTMAATQSS